MESPFLRRPPDAPRLLDRAQCKDVEVIVFWITIFQVHQYPVLTCRAVLVHSQWHEGRKHGQASMLTGGRIADGEACPSLVSEKEEAVAGGIQTDGVVKLDPGDMLDLGVGGPIVEGGDVLVLAVAAVYVFAFGGEGDGWLAAVVCKEELAGGH